MKLFKDLSEAEQQIMEYLWSCQESKTLGELLDYFNETHNKGWKSQTLSTFMEKKKKKEIVTWTVTGRTKHYYPSLTKTEFESKKAKGILDSMYNSSLKKFVATLYKGNQLSEKEVEDLKEWLNKQEN